jgi:hypothetical protein
MPLQLREKFQKRNSISKKVLTKKPVLELITRKKKH